MTLDIDTGQYENVYVYVGDAVRWDSTPEAILSSGYSIKTVASSTHSPSSFASLVTGRDVPNHGVYDFDDALRDDMTTLFDIDGYDTRFINSIQAEPSKKSPIYDVLRQPRYTYRDPFEDVDTPFVIVERGPGGHAPYDSVSGSVPEYFKRISTDSRERIRQDYETGVSIDAQLFAERQERLEERGLADKTLVIYTSDHGELLGEHGMLGHNAPMHPALVYVPTVFVTGTAQKSDGERIFRHTDLFPTILDVIDVSHSLASSFDGVSILSDEVQETGMSYFSKRFGPKILWGELEYRGLWDSNGGYVVTDSAMHRRLLTIGGKLLLSPKRRFLMRNLVEIIRATGQSEFAYGDFRFSRSMAVDRLNDVTRTTAKRSDLDEQTIDQLQHLGYRR